MSRTPVVICGCGRGQRSEVQDEVATPASPPWSPLPGEKRPHKAAPAELDNAPAYGPLELALPPPPGTCCCWTLRQGCIGIAALFYVIALVSFVGCLLHPAEHDFKGDDETIVHFCYMLFMIVAALKMILSVMLLFGILRDRTDLVRPWLISYFIICPLEASALLTSGFIALLVMFWGVGVSLLIAALAYIGIYSFCLYVLYTYYSSQSEVTISNV